MPNAASYLLVKETIDVAAHIIRWLGMPGIVGLAMMEAHYEGSPWRSAKQLALRADCSEDTARRKAEELVRCGRACSQRMGTRTCYAIEPRVAEIVMERMTRFQLATEPQLASGTCTDLEAL